MATEANWYAILSLFERYERVLALVALVVNAVALVSIPLLPPDQRLYGVISFLVVLVVTLICTAVVVVFGSRSQHHDQPFFRRKIKTLRERLDQNSFRPQLIMAISRSGLAVGGDLAKQLGDKEIVPVISLSRTRGREFDNPFNHVSFTHSDFDLNTTDPIRILIVDDICLTGRTLDDARAYVKRHVDPDKFVIETAAISYYDSHQTRATPPSFFVDVIDHPVRDAFGDLEV